MIPRIPRKIGYWLGYKAIELLSIGFTIEQLMVWEMDIINANMRKAIEGLISTDIKP